MNDKEKHIDYQDLISKYLAKEASREDIILLEKWVSQNETNKKLYNETKNIWVLANINNTKNKIDVDSEWNKIEDKLFESKKITIQPQDKKNSFNQFYKIAASVIVLLSVSFFLYFLISNSGQQKFVADNSVKTSTLSDGSVITLNHNSSLVYYKDVKDKRKVKLSGDAFFNVKPDASKPFIIETQNADVEVLGTSFYVDSHIDKPTIEVTVKTGKVAFRVNNQELILLPGDKGVFDKSTGELVQELNDNINFIAWKTKYFIFDNTSLTDVVSQLNSVYHANITIASPNLNNCRITARFDNQSIDAVLNVIKETLDLRIDKNNDGIRLTGDSCK